MSAGKPAKVAPGTPLVTADELAATLGMPVPTTNADVASVAAAADTFLTPYLTPGVDHTTHDADRRAALEIAVNMYQSAKSAGGQPVSVDFTPAPYQMGASLMRRVSGIIAPCRDVAGMVG